MRRPAPRQHLRRALEASDRGSLSLFTIAVAVGLLVIIGLVVDGSGRIRALQHAQDAAREAARSGGQAIQAPPAIRGTGLYADSAAARAAARAYLAAAGVNGSVSIQGGDTLVVDTTSNYSPLFLSAAGFGTATVHGHSTAQIIRAVGGVQR